MYVKVANAVLFHVYEFGVKEDSVVIAVSV
jgi:hypothetical protein